MQRRTCWGADAEEIVGPIRTPDGGMTDEPLLRLKARAVVDLLGGRSADVAQSERSQVLGFPHARSLNGRFVYGQGSGSFGLGHCQGTEPECVGLTNPDRSFVALINSLACYRSSVSPNSHCSWL